jgi:ferrochelatase
MTTTEIRDKKTKGVLLVNLGTPDSYHPSAVYRYLNEFLTDERVIDMSWLRRQILVRGVIVPLRFRQSAKLYRRLWTPEGSPLLVHGRDVESKLQAALGDSYHVVLAMRYQSPSIEQGLEKLRGKQVEELIVLPLFPQYASATTGSVHQKVMEKLQRWEVIPKLVLINQFCDHPKMIEAICARAKQHRLDSYDHILFSFHGLPERQIRRADPSGKCLTPNCCQASCSAKQFCYKAQCYATARALVERLSLRETDYTVCFQSRLGRDPWLQPYTSSVLENLAEKGMKRILVFCPSFVCDCLETTCEISLEYGEEFKKRGGEELQLVEGLNSHPAWIEALQSLVTERG